ncbi:MAG: 4-(cytidine 5'-diphospho)-2-C-methyl-D-erythritol kinase [Thermoguttaceae bacterium]
MSPKKRPAPAKLNLFLEVLGKRPDQYHELVSLVAPISLFDELSCEPRPDSDWEFHCQFDNSQAGECQCQTNECQSQADEAQMSELGLGQAQCPFPSDIPQDATNLVIRALNCLRDRYCPEMGGVVRLLKRIPSQAGLGGGSSDAATALLLANEIWELGLSRAELAGIGAELGSDVPLFLAEETVIFRGRGEKVEQVPDLPQLHFVLLKPREGLSTGRVFAEMMKRHDQQFRLVEPVLDALRKNDLARFGQLLFNRLEEAAVSIWPEMDRYFRAFDDLGTLAVRMSGSGTALFGLCSSEQQAERVTRALRTRQLGSVFQVKTVCNPRT